jgi:hypothetical protein
VAPIPNTDTTPLMNNFFSETGFRLIWKRRIRKLKPREDKEAENNQSVFTYVSRL